MILRRVINHMKSQHGTGVFIATVIVIFDIFIDTRGSNRNTARHAAEGEH